MTPRKYDPGQRAISMEATRNKILDATIALHTERGIVATSYRDIATRADVGIGTVYHHFPHVEDLVMACGGRQMALTRPPTAEIFHGLRSRRARIERLVVEVFAWYERYPAWRRAICDADKLDILAQGVKRRDALLVELIQVALGEDIDADTTAAVRAVIDFEAYRVLVDGGRTAVQAATIITSLLRSGI